MAVFDPRFVVRRSPREGAERTAGFTVREGAKHVVVQHPEFPGLVATVTRSSPLPTGYILALLELVSRVEEGRKGAP